MKKEYGRPILTVETILGPDTAIASPGRKDCVGEDNVTDTVTSGTGEGYVYYKNGQLFYCYGLGD